MYFAFKTYPGGGAFALFFHPHPREFATQNKKSANARGLARGGMGAAGIDWCISTPPPKKKLCYLCDLFLHLRCCWVFFGGGVGLLPYFRKLREIEMAIVQGKNSLLIAWKLISQVGPPIYTFLGSIASFAVHE